MFCTDLCRPPPGGEPSRTSGKDPRKVWAGGAGGGRWLGVMVIDHEDGNLSDKEVYSNNKNIPAIGEIRFLSSPGQEIKIVKERLGLRV